MTVQPRQQLARHTDLGNAQRLVARYGDVIRYVQATSTWHVWDGQVWAPDDTGKVSRYARATVRAMQRAASTIDDADEKDKMWKWGVASESATRLGSMIALSRDEDGVAVRAADFNTEVWALNTPAGIVDLRTGAVEPHDPARMHSQITAAAPVALPGGRWEAFVKLALPDRKVRAYVQRLVGASLIGAPLGPPATLPFLFGEGGTGKSTLLEPLVAALGNYACMAPPNLLAAKRGGGDQTYDIAALRGKRFVVASEGHSRQQLAEDVVKRVTADATLAGRQIREAELTWQNVTALWFMSNHEPRIDATDTGLQRRIKEIPMDVMLGVEHKGLREAIVAEELPAVLAWAVAGCVAWQKDGSLDAPTAVTDATQAFFDDANVLLDWLACCCTPDPRAQHDCAELHASYLDWCADNHHTPMYRTSRGRAWGRALKSVGMEPFRSTTARGYQGFRLDKPSC